MSYAFPNKNECGTSWSIVVRSRIWVSSVAHVWLDTGLPLRVQACFYCLLLRMDLPISSAPSSGIVRNVSMGSIALSPSWGHEVRHAHVR